MQQPHFSLTVQQAAANLPVDLPYIKSWLRIDSGDHDQHITELIDQARQLCEEFTGRAFVNTTYLYQADRFPIIPNSQYAPGNPSILAPVLQNVWPLDPSIWAIKLPRSPLQSVVSLNYIDVNGNMQSMTQGGLSGPPAANSFFVDTSSEPPRLAPSTGSYWPNVRWQPNAVQITFTAGYGATGNLVPNKWRRAIAATAGYWYDNPNGPDDRLPVGVERMLYSDDVAEVW